MFVGLCHNPNFFFLSIRVSKLVLKVDCLTQFVNFDLRVFKSRLAKSYESVLRILLQSIELDNRGSFLVESYWNDGNAIGKAWR